MSNLLTISSGFFSFEANDLFLETIDITFNSWKKGKQKIDFED